MLNNRISNYKGIIEQLQCPDCKKRCCLKNNEIYCNSCKRAFNASSEFLDMMPIKQLPPPKIYFDPEYLKYKKIYKDALYYHYQKKGIESTVNHRVHNYIKKFIRKKRYDLNGICVDLGFGTGVFWENEIKFDKLIAVELVDELLKMGSEKFSSIPFIKSDAYCLPFENESVDWIIALGVIEHIYYLEEAIDEIERVLKPNGKFIMTIPTEGGFAWNFGRLITSHRYFKKKYNIDYQRALKIEHCNTASKLIGKLSNRFNTIASRYDPFFIPLIDINIFYHAVYCKK